MEIKVATIKDIQELVDKGYSINGAIEKLRSDGYGYLKKNDRIVKLTNAGTTHKYIMKRVKTIHITQPKSVAEVILKIEEGLNELKRELNLPGNLSDTVRHLNDISREVKRIDKHGILEFKKKLENTVKSFGNTQFTTKDVLHRMYGDNYEKRDYYRVVVALREMALSGKIRLVNRIPYNITNPINNTVFKSANRINVWKNVTV